MILSIVVYSFVFTPSYYLCYLSDFTECYNNYDC